MAHLKQDQPLHTMFTAVPPRYDLINRIITLGMDRCWRKAAAEVCIEFEPKRMLDLACGTGDFILAIARKMNSHTESIGLDYSEPMLDIARNKAKQVAGSTINFVHGNAADLPFPDSHFDCAGISFAFRNLTYNNPLTPKVLAEVLRVLRSGGRFVIVESSQPESVFIRFFFRLYLRCYVYPVGRLLSGNSDAYHYLAESAARFYTPVQVRDMLISSGFSSVWYRPLFFGAAGIHVAVK
jgi:demethylmenaquinone methyltransferase/2-methoxy-6-polyprenyl-1,4-benzoquinol methylase